MLAMKRTMSIGTKTKCRVEQCFILKGRHQGRAWIGWMLDETRGTPVAVDFDATKVMEIEERTGHIIGFYHTHPNMSACPSSTDIRTMRAWVSCFGKPLICVIHGSDGLHSFLFRTDESSGKRLYHTELMDGKVILGVEHGRCPCSRKALSRRRCLAKVR
jgi:proteasome lid subunit RPN8/RPN11